MSEVIGPTLDERGKLAKGNIWKMPAFRPGESGHTARYTAARLANVASEYVELRGERQPTWSGLAAHLGISRQALDRYAKGEIGKEPTAIVAVLEYFRTLMESRLEDRLTDKNYATQGVIFALKNQAGDAWKDEKHLSVDQTTTNQLVVQVSAELGAMLQAQAGSGLSVIEGESTVVDLA